MDSSNNDSLKNSDVESTNNPEKTIESNLEPEIQKNINGDASNQSKDATTIQESESEPLAEDHALSESFETKCTVFLGGINKELTPLDLTIYFSKFGEIKSIDMKHGYGFITFASSDIAQKVIAEDNHVVKEHKIETKSYFPKAKIVVRKLKKTLEEKDIREYFEKFGKITSFKRPKGHKGESFSFCHITFETQEQAQNAIKNDSPTIKEKILSVSMHKPNQEKDPKPQPSKVVKKYKDNKKQTIKEKMKHGDKPWGRWSSTNASFSRSFPRSSTNASFSRSFHPQPRFEFSGPSPWERRESFSSMSYKPVLSSSSFSFESKPDFSPNYSRFGLDFESKSPYMSSEKRYTNYAEIMDSSHYSRAHLPSYPRF